MELKALCPLHGVAQWRTVTHGDARDARDARRNDKPEPHATLLATPSTEKLNAIAERNIKKINNT